MIGRAARIASAAVAALLASALGAPIGAPLGAQGGASVVRGVAFDSVRGAPLPNAFVTLGARSTSADASGRFRFDSVARGRHTLTMQHAALEALGITGVSVPVVADDADRDVTLASPSFATLWRGICGAGTPPRDSGFVYGTVTDPRGALVANATVDVSWVEIGSLQRRRLVQRIWRSTARTDTAGRFAACGVPADMPLRVQAATDSASSGAVDLPADHPRVLRRDLRVSPLTGAAGAERGDVAGVVTDSTGIPIAGARVAAEEVDEVRTDSAGRFVIRSVPTGTRQLEVLALGMSPVTAVVDVVAGQVAEVWARVRRITKLDVVRVLASPMIRQRVERIEERRRQGVGYFRDSTEIGSHGTIARVLAELPGTFVEQHRATSNGQFSLTMRSIKGEPCEPAVWIDMAPTSVAHLTMLRPAEVAVLEVYPRAFGVPSEFTAATEGNRTCGAVAVWTRFYLR